MISRICCIYFSATGNTKKLALAAANRAAEETGLPVEELDFTKPANRAEVHEFGPEDFVIIASPTYAGKLPNKILPDFKEKLRGNGTPSAAIVTFGNRSFDNSLAELVSVLKAGGFYPLGGAAFACRHAFTDLLAPDRPAGKDLAKAGEFAVNCLKLAENKPFMAERPELIVDGDADAPYYVPKGTDGQPAKFLKAKPLTDMGKCSRCGICVELCPVGSVNPADPADVPGICIKCQACVRGCPEGAKYFDDAAFLSHVAMLEQNFREPKGNRFFYV